MLRSLPDHLPADNRFVGLFAAESREEPRINTNAHEYQRDRAMLPKSFVFIRVHSWFKTFPSWKASVLSVSSVVKPILIIRVDPCHPWFKISPHSCSPPCSRVGRRPRTKSRGYGMAPGWSCLPARTSDRRSTCLPFIWRKPSLASRKFSIRKAPLCSAILAVTALQCIAANCRQSLSIFATRY